MRTRLQPLFLGAFLIFVGSPLLSSAELGMRSFGIRGGVSSSPDQFLGGVFVNAGQLFSNLRLQPSFEFAVGNGVRIGSANGDVLYPFHGRSWHPYAGAGLGVTFTDVTNGVGEGRGLQIEPALNVIGGVEWGGSHRASRPAPYRYVIEARAGFGNVADFKLTAGFVF